MKVKELKEELDQYYDDMDVFVTDEVVGGKLAIEFVSDDFTQHNDHFLDHTHHVTLVTCQMTDRLHEILEPLMLANHKDLLAIGNYIADEFDDGAGSAINEMLKRFVKGSVPSNEETLDDRA
jgi:hypothetical protein